MDKEPQAEWTSNFKLWPQTGGGLNFQQVSLTNLYLIRLETF